MLDTVILLFKKGLYQILNKQRFNLISAKQINGITIYQKWVNNATPEEERLYIYRPLLTRMENLGREESLKIQFSAQKIIFKNSLQEIDATYFEQVLEVLQKSILEMGVSIDKETLRYAAVMSFHPAKNIPIIGGYSAMGIIKELAKINLTGKMDLDEKRFRNDGHGLQYYAKSHSLTFYDKIKDLEKSEKKAYDSDQKLQQANLFDLLQQKKKPEVLRMEVRLSEKQKMNSVLDKLGFKINPTFADIFKNEVWQKVLLHYFETYIESNLFIFDFDDSPQGILKSILRKNPKMKIDEAMKLASLKVFCKDDGGVRGLRNIIEPRAGRRKWQYITPKIKTLNRKIGLNSCHGYIKQIKQSLQKFKPYEPKIDEKLST